VTCSYRCRPCDGGHGDGDGDGEHGDGDGEHGDGDGCRRDGDGDGDGDGAPRRRQPPAASRSDVVGRGSSGHAG
jgi:hypothetical protein